MEPVQIQYIFTLTDGSRESFLLRLNPKSLELEDNTPYVLPSWTILDFHQCPHCPLDTDTHPHCPLSKNLVIIVDRFDRILSYDKVHLDITTQERHISQDTTAQRAISSLMGLVMATSGCPYFAFFKPMARYHLPLASEKETIYRATSMYLLAQYFLNKSGQNTDLSLEGLSKIYDDIQLVNASVAERIRAGSRTDSTINALILLDFYAKALPIVIEESLDELRYLFSAYLEE